MNKQDDKWVTKDFEHDLRLQMEKESLKTKIQIQQQKLELK
jgi:hypothetical protein